MIRPTVACDVDMRARGLRRKDDAFVIDEMLSNI